MSFLTHIKGPAGAGPGERHRMLERAADAFEDAGWPKSSIVRVDVPGRGQSAAGEEAVRPEVEPVVPALQSGSMFADKTGVLIVDAHQLKATEAQALAELLETADRELCRAVLVSSGELAAPLKKAVKAHGETQTIKWMTNEEFQRWLADAARRHGLHLSATAKNALKELFRFDVAAIEQALTQLEMAEGNITPEMIKARFENRPQTPTWEYFNALEKGEKTKALRFLRNFMTNSHPIVLIAVLEDDLRKRALAADAPDVETYADWTNPGLRKRWLNSKASDTKSFGNWIMSRDKSARVAFPTKKAWLAGRAMSPQTLLRAVDALRRADAILKNKYMPDVTHLVTMERLTIALMAMYSDKV